MSAKHTSPRLPRGERRDLEITVWVPGEANIVWRHRFKSIPTERLQQIDDAIAQLLQEYPCESYDVETMMYITEKNVEAHRAYD